MTESKHPSAPPPADPHQGLFAAGEQIRTVALPASEEGRVSASLEAKKRMGLVAAGLVGLMLATYVVPGLERFQPWARGEGYIPFWNLLGRELLGQGKQLEEQQQELARLRALAQDPPAPQDPEAPKVPSSLSAALSTSAVGPIFPPYATHSEDAAPAVILEHPERLDAFYGQLTLADLKVPKAVARVGHWGDSILGDDGLTHGIRTRVQTRFGDAGHGFHVLGRYNLAYLHRGVRYRDRGDWLSRCEIIFKCESDGHYGYGGVSSRSAGGGTGWWSTSKEGIGSRVSRFEFWYAAMPEGGDFQIKIDGELKPVLKTAAPELRDEVAVFEVPDGPHEFEVRAIGNGVARGYGVVLEREGPGIVWDSLALIGSFTQRLDYQDAEHIANQIRQRNLNLLVFLMGGNDVQREKMDLYRNLDPYESEYTAVLRKFRAGKPQASCLVMSLSDHGERVGAHGVRTRRIVPKLVAAQRKVAIAEGCAFFDTFAAMGGEGSIERWYRSKPPLAGGDLGHPTSEGHEVLAALFHKALMHGYAQYRSRMVGQPLPELDLPKTAQ